MSEHKPLISNKTLALATGTAVLLIAAFGVAASRADNTQRSGCTIGQVVDSVWNNRSDQCLPSFRPNPRMP